MTSTESPIESANLADQAVLTIDIDNDVVELLDRNHVNELPMLAAKFAQTAFHDYVARKAVKEIQGLATMPSGYDVKPRNVKKQSVEIAISFDKYFDKYKGASAIGEGFARAAAYDAAFKQYAGQVVSAQLALESAEVYEGRAAYLKKAACGNDAAP